MIVFKNPWILYTIPLVLALVYFIKSRQRDVSFRFPSKTLLTLLGASWKVRFRFVPQMIRYVVLALFLLALAGPRSVLEETVYKTEGIDIVLAIDSSGSMAAEDFIVGGKRVNRLAIVKDVVKEFIEKRENDQIGLVAFAGLAYTVCPLTTDYSWLERNLERVELGLIRDGTAVGSAIASSIARLKTSKAKSKVIILLTDGNNNAGKIDPLTAARAAKTYGVKIYTIGAGTKGRVPYPTRDFFGRKVYQNVIIELDEETLQEVSDITGGKYFRASGTKALREIYKEIDALERTEIEKIGYFEYHELFDQVLLAALLLLVIELVLSRTLLLKVP